MRMRCQLLSSNVELCMKRVKRGDMKGIDVALPDNGALLLSLTPGVVMLRIRDEIKVVV